MKNHEELKMAMIAYEEGCPKRIQHFLKVYGFARLIAGRERIPESVQEVLEAAALVHDIGIRPALEKYGSSQGPLQEKEGPPKAEEMLRGLGYPEADIARISYLVGHHHTYTDIDGIDYQILVEADFLVNLYEDGSSRKSIEAAYRRIFRTETGCQICRTMFGLDQTGKEE